MVSYLKMKELKMREIEKVFTRKKRRAVSDIIATLLMVVITVAGGIVVLNFVQTTDIIQSTETISSEEAAISIKITGYDTRDSCIIWDCYYLKRISAYRSYRNFIALVIINPIIPETTA